MKMKTQFLVIIALIILVSLLLFTQVNRNNEGEQATMSGTAEEPVAVDLTDQVIDIFELDCAAPGCHAGSRPKKSLNLEPDEMMAALINVQSLQRKDLKLVDTAMPQQSYMLMKIKGDEGIIDERMPVEAPPLDEDKIRVIEEWVFSLAEEMKE